MNAETTVWAQEGVITRAQALATMTEAQVKWKITSGRWQVIHSGVYLTHSGEPTWAARCWAGLLYYGEGAALSLESAAHTLRFEANAPPHVHIDIPHTGSAVRRLHGVRVRRRRRLPTVQRRGLRVTAPAFTVLDLADDRWASRADAIAIAARAVQRKATSVEELAAELELRRAHRHRFPLQLALGAVAEGAESGLEVTYLDSVVGRHGLPPMVLNSADVIGGSRVRRDFKNEQFGVVSEVDGELGHVGADRLIDARRDRKTLATGRVTARQGWIDVHFAPCELAADLYGIYRSRGYRGGIALCGPNCTVMRHIALLSAG